ncbi:hypothetical protein K2X14_07890 [Acetobacter sp. TBRC 12305]|uniref:Uncharacterized protein n=1 Tax=Acetobacter garciniae TaxID=2817435 RepID=A0A939HNW5_9PROT|nr:hypothetical protein [Acetobacter garciniae]MBO1325274.1 hypothetical protein [Acetobacter garciniae]MBX0344754.1 hypothetical protein [Acetobacter garciniae]
MTDPRIEAALKAAWQHTTQHENGQTFEQWKDVSSYAAEEFRRAIVAAVAAADAVDPLRQGVSIPELPTNVPIQARQEND